MKYTQLKPGDPVIHFCCGHIVKGRVIDIHPHGFISEHEPIRWGNTTFAKTNILRPTLSQRVYAGNKMVPKCYYKKELVTE